MVFINTYLSPNDANQIAVIAATSTSRQVLCCSYVLHMSPNQRVAYHQHIELV